MPHIACTNHLRRYGHSYIDNDIMELCCIGTEYSGV